MPTKGPSNRYGNTRGSKQGHATKKISYPWAKGFNKSSLAEHYDKHAGKMGFKTTESYIAHALKFANNVDKKNYESFVNPKTGSTYKYGKITNEFAIVTKDGYVITYYHPEKGYAYFRQLKSDYGKRRAK